MSSPFVKPSEVARGEFFKPANHMTDLALLIEAKRIDRNVPNEYKGVTKPRDEVTADITIFGTSEALEKGVPTRVLRAAVVVHAGLTSRLEQAIGAPFLGVVRKQEMKNGSGYTFEDCNAAVEEQVAAFYTKREAAIKAALADAPDFD